MSARALVPYAHCLLVAVHAFVCTRKASAQAPPVSTAQGERRGPAAAESASGAGLSLTDRRALMYLYSRLDQTHQARAVAEDILREFPGDKATLELLFSIYYEKRETELAEQTARRWIEHHPNDPDAKASLARVMQMDGRPTAAREILQELRAQHPIGKPFAYEEDLAAAAEKSGDWPQAINSYQELLNSAQLSPAMQNSVRQQLDHLYRTHLPQATVRGSYVSPRSGSILRTSAAGSVPVGTHYRLGARLDRDNLTVKEAQFLKETRTDRFDLLAGVQWQRYPWQLQFWAGGGSEGPMARASAQRTITENATVTLSLAAGDRAVDSLLLEALDGREDKATLQFSTTLGNWTYVDVQIQGRRVNLGDETLGYGYMASANISRSIFPDFPEVRAGYRGLVTGFEREASDPGLVNKVADSTAAPIDRFLLLDNLIEPINLHGLFVAWEHEFNPRLRFRIDSGADYSFERSDFGYSSEAGLSFFPTKSLELILEGGYSTSAETSNAESELVQVSLALRYLF